MNQVDTKKLHSVVADMLRGQTEPIMFNMRHLFEVARINSLPSRHRFNEVADLTSNTSFCKEVGFWCLAEIEGPICQLSPITSRFMTLQFGVTNIYEIIKDETFTTSINCAEHSLPLGSK